MVHLKTRPCKGDLYKERLILKPMVSYWGLSNNRMVNKQSSRNRCDLLKISCKVLEYESYNVKLGLLGPTRPGGRGWIYLWLSG